MEPFDEAQGKGRKDKMTLIYVAVTLMILMVVFLVAYLVRGLKFALGTSLAAFFILSIFYAGLVMFITSQMP